MKMYLLNKIKLSNYPYKKLYLKFVDKKVFYTYNIDLLKLELINCKRVRFTFYCEALYDEIITDYCDGDTFYNFETDEYYILNIIE